MKKTFFAAAILGLAAAVSAAPAFAGTVYSSGSSSYNFDAWTVNYGFVVSDEFTLTSTTTFNGATFAAWAFPGDSLSSIDWSIGTASYTTPMTTAATTGSLIESNDYGYNVLSESFSIPTMTLGPGTYWFTLGNASVPDGDPIYWDENDGSSIGYENSVGSIGDFQCEMDNGCGLSGGETFALTNTTATPEPSSFLLLGSGLAGFAGMIRRKIKA